MTTVPVRCAGGSAGVVSKKASRPASDLATPLDERTAPKSLHVETEILALAV